MTDCIKAITCRNSSSEWKSSHFILQKAIEKHPTYRGRRQYPVGNAKARSQGKSHVKSYQPAHQGDGYTKCCSDYNPCAMMLVIDNLERWWLSRGDNNIRHFIKICSILSSYRRAFVWGITGKTLIWENNQGEDHRILSIRLCGKALNMSPSIWYVGHEG